MTQQSRADNRCRVVLITPQSASDDALVDMVRDALSDAAGMGDVASLIVPQHDLQSVTYQKRLEELVPVTQAAGVALFAVNDTQAFGRSGADGLHVEDGFANVRSYIERFAPEKMIGAGNIKARHVALETGELNPDYVFFGKLNGDIRDEAHPKNLALGDWWSDLIEIPCIVMGGQTLESAVEVAETGAEFVALSSAVFMHEKGAKSAVLSVNEMLDAQAPDLETDDA